MKVLVACEESQVVCKAFRERGHEAYSCDTQECSGGHPEWHIKDDVLKHLDDGWDLMIAHPPCTYLSRAGARWLYKGGVINNSRYVLGVKAKDFFMRLYEANIKMIAIENPTPFKVFDLPKPSQAINPHDFGHEYSKRTLLWLKNLPPLLNTLIYPNHKPYMPSNTGGKKRGQKYHFTTINSHDASRTFQGIAEAFATQWG
uniref:Methyltransferase n=1 Tax=viral metagenome TaxID=1070528 RepID=A0A6H2A1P1_9ZZZZ